MRTHHANDERIATFFAIFPVVIGWKVKWLCRVRVLYRYEDHEGLDASGFASDSPLWQPVAFLPLDDATQPDGQPSSE